MSEDDQAAQQKRLILILFCLTETRRIELTHSLEDGKEKKKSWLWKKKQNKCLSAAIPFACAASLSHSNIVTDKNQLESLYSVSGYLGSGSRPDVVPVQAVGDANG